MALSNQIVNDHSNNGPRAAASTVSMRRINSAHVASRANPNAGSYSQANTSAKDLGKGKKNEKDSERTKNSQTEDSLEYFIKFPSPKYDNEPTLEADIYLPNNDAYVPLVFLLGWAGCQHRYLMKYSKIYEDRGLITLRYTAPVETLFWKRSAMISIGEQILKLIYEMNLDSHPLFFHIFSNGGAYLYQHIMLATQRHHTPLQIRGIIFDSAPGERRMLGLYRAVTAIYGKEKRKCNCLSAVFITVTLGLVWFVEETFAAFKGLFVKNNLPKQTNPFNDLKNEPNNSPQLFLYSRGDAVIPYHDIEKFIHIRESQGVPVTSMCFEDAEHVKIFTKYPNQYIHCVCQFINRCLSSPFGGGTGDAVLPSTQTATMDSIELNPSKFN